MDATSELVIVSQLQHKDLLMFLLAVKTFAKQIKPRRVFVLNDGSLTNTDRALLSTHLPGVTVLELTDFRAAACPTGGCWERLLAISTLVRENYVIQLDSDTLTEGAIDDVRRCITEQRAFALGTWDNQDFESMDERAQVARKLDLGQASHVQVIAEAHFDQLEKFKSLRYVRGCAGFAGFARQSFEREFVETISVQMRAAIGGKWAEWGSEQVMSNIVVANTPNAIVLPHPKYADCHKMKPGVTEFIHFIGSCRFDRGQYAKLGAELIATL